MRKNIRYGWIIAALAVMVIVIFPMIILGTIAMGMDRSRYFDSLSNWEPKLTFSNAPEGTAYLDILIKLPENSEDYVDFAEWKECPKILIDVREVTEAVDHGNGNFSEKTKREPIYEDVNITFDSDIVKYSEDGYISLSAHYRGCKGFTSHYDINEDKSVCSISLDMGNAGMPGADFDLCPDDFWKISKRYGDLKAAYVDKDGKVLGVTNAAIPERSVYKAEITANGDVLTVNLYKSKDIPAFVFFIALFGEPLAIIGLVICIVFAVRQDKGLPNLNAREKNRK